MTTSPAGRAFIREHEGCKLTAYRDSGGVVTIGVGHVPATMGQTITQAEADALLTVDLARAENCINTAVTAALNQSQFDALVSFVFNVGCGAFRASTLLKLLNAGDYRGAAQQLMAWVYAGGREVEGLRNRRHDEQILFQAPFTQV